MLDPARRFPIVYPAERSILDLSRRLHGARQNDSQSALMGPCISIYTPTLQRVGWIRPYTTWDMDATKDAAGARTLSRLGEDAEEVEGHPRRRDTPQRQRDESRRRASALREASKHCNSLSVPQMRYTELIAHYFHAKMRSPRFDLRAFDEHVEVRLLSPPHLINHMFENGPVMAAFQE